MNKSVPLETKRCESLLGPSGVKTFLVSLSLEGSCGNVVYRELYGNWGGGGNRAELSFISEPYYILSFQNNNDGSL